VSDRRRGLGRGLGALIPSAPTADDLDEPRQNAPFGVDVLIPERRGTPAEQLRRPGEPADSAPAEAPDPPDESDAASADDAAQPEAAAPAASPADLSSTSSDEPEREPARPVGDMLAVPGAVFAELPITAITPNARQPRQVFDEDAMAELVHSIQEIGLLQPVVVRRIDAADGAGADGPRFELVMGERRWRATQEAGLDTIPAIVRDTDDTDMLRDALLENLHRSQLNPLEEAAAYDQLLHDFACTHDELAARIGRSRPQVSNTLRLLRLPPLVQRRVAAGVLSAGHARALLGLEDAAAQERLAQRIVAEGLSVRAVEEIVALGGDGSTDKTPRRRTNRPVAPRLEDLATSLSDRFETRVKVDLGRRKGRIVVEFASIDDLERIVGLMDPAASPGAGTVDADRGDTPDL
jgi:ParB family chromosome partitioning protein